MESNSTECWEWLKLAETALAPILKWREMKALAGKLAGKEIEKAKERRHGDAHEKRIAKKWHEILHKTLLLHAIEFRPLDGGGNNRIDLVTALKTVEAARAALLDNGKEMPKLFMLADEAAYKAQFKNWKKLMALNYDNK
uniref:CRISPR type III-B/RAMP module-associated protein Cmr5 n=1 Tax=Globodera pallida TaxID=36090 RepID=A0A183BJ51_GLOPA